MRRTVILLFFATVMAQFSRAEERLLTRPINSPSLNSARTIRIYLPPSYYGELKRRYPVLYLHDGQNVFSSAGTNACFGWGNWELDTTVDELCKAGRMEEIIMVGVDSSASRVAEYWGSHHGTNSAANTEFEKYDSFLIQELKPKIDSEYRTKSEPKHTGVMGSSMGGICSIILAWDHPEVFGRAASLSGAFQVDTNFLQDILRPYHGNAKPTRLYLDSGAVDFTGGDDGRRSTEAVAKEFERIGWGKELMHYVDEKPLAPAELEKAGLRRDKWSEAQTSQHNEFYWRLRVWRALTFLFPPAK
ncbi:MAG: hypothetical protein C5B50_26730 [Verrucomicrobia bacterium]|nr:MAG: hypothetical protein C5B50_26730 [Verrucomicrobiota bacterium]